MSGSDGNDGSNVRVASHDDLSTIGTTHGAAFLDDPIARWMVGERRTTEKRVGRIYEALAAGHLGDGLSYMTPDGEAVAVWAAPKRFKVPIRKFTRHIPGVLRALGPAGFARLVSMADVEKMHPPEPHYYLAVLGTHPDQQGHGYATATMSPVFRRADAEGVGCYLESSKEENVPFYRRNGFEVTGTYDLSGGRGPRMWLMWRDPQPTG